ncbi:hypothetical protein KKC44_03830 [Patescibacteria group bacterium]|nr:hypothetical protein [Patescibacteria group bacterium]MBU2259711.1 hypothetical protein [Patescibacteria group bacterium]
MQKVFVAILIVVLAFFPRCLEGQSREWKDIRGQSMRAEFLRFQDGMVVLRKGSRVLKVDLWYLSKDDQIYVQEKKRELWEAKLKRLAFRTWTDASGKFTVEGTAVGLNDGKVSLVKQDGKAIEVELSVLSKQDQDYIKRKLVFLLVDFTGWWEVGSDGLVNLVDKGDSIQIGMPMPFGWSYGPKPWPGSANHFNLSCKGSAAVETEKDSRGYFMSGVDKGMSLVVVNDLEMSMRTQQPDYIKGSDGTMQQGGKPETYPMRRLRGEEEQRMIAKLNRIGNERGSSFVIALGAVAAIAAAASDPSSVADLGKSLGDSKSAGKSASGGSDESSTPSGSKSSAGGGAGIDLYLKWHTGKPAGGQAVVYDYGFVKYASRGSAKTDSNGYCRLEIGSGPKELQIYFNGKTVFNGSVEGSSISRKRLEVTMPDTR